MQFYICALPQARSAKRIQRCASDGREPWIDIHAAEAVEIGCYLILLEARSGRLAIICDTMHLALMAIDLSHHSLVLRTVDTFCGAG